MVVCLIAAVIVVFWFVVSRCHCFGLWHLGVIPGVSGGVCLIAAAFWFCFRLWHLGVKTSVSGHRSCDLCVSGLWRLGVMSTDGQVQAYFLSPHYHEI